MNLFENKFSSDHRLSDIIFLNFSFCQVKPEQIIPAEVDYFFKNGEVFAFARKNKITKKAYHILQQET